MTYDFLAGEIWEEFPKPRRGKGRKKHQLCFTHQIFVGDTLGKKAIQINNVGKVKMPQITPPDCGRSIQEER